MADDNRMSRRKLLTQSGIITTGGALTLAGNAIAETSSSGNRGWIKELDSSSIKELSLRDLAIETAIHDSRPVAAFTSINIGDGFQLYLAQGVTSEDDSPKQIKLLTNAQAGVHAPSWETETDLKYSMDGATFVETILENNGVSIQSDPSRKLVSNEPLPVVGTKDGMSAMAKVVKCMNPPFVGGWCIRLHHKDSGHTPRCSNNPTPSAMVHSHFSIFPQSNAKGGINIWAGSKGNCFFVGEEHYTDYCVRICGNGGIPGLGALKNAFENAINHAADAAGIAIPGAIVAAAAYFLAGSTLAPPTGVPLV